MKKKYLSLVIGVMSIFSIEAMGQSVSPVDFMRMNPFQTQSNVATPLPYNSFFSFAVGDVNMNLTNGPFRYDNFFNFDADGKPTSFNLNKLANSLSEVNNLRMNASENVFGIGGVSAKAMITYNHRIRMESFLTVNDDLFQLAANGNSAFIGADNPAKINVGINAMAFQEFSLGYQRMFGKNLSIGIRAKLLFGIMNIETQQCDIELQTDADSYGVRIKENLDMMVSTPVPLVNTTEGWQLQSRVSLGDLFKNVGFGADIAAQYKINDKFEVSAALNDFGIIYWKKNGKTFYSTTAPAGQYFEDGSFFFSGFTSEELQKLIDDKEYRKQYFDTLRSYFPYETKELQEYKKNLNLNPMLRGSFFLTPENRFSAQFQGVIAAGEFYPAFTIAYDGSFIRMFDVCVTYTMMRNSYDNLGLGLAFNLRFFHIFATTNNLVGLFNPGNTSNLNARVGVVLNFRDR